MSPWRGCTEKFPDGRDCNRPYIKTNGRGWRTCGGSHEGSAVSAKVDRNGPCPCGCGRKAKKCCAPSDRETTPGAALRAELGDEA